MSNYVILCVDDERIILESLRMELKGVINDVRIDVSDNGAEAIELVKSYIQNNLDVVAVISDQRMPGMKGDELLAQIHRLTPKTLTILLTGYTDIEAVKNAVNNASLYRYISKPWESNDLILTVNEAFKSYLQEKLIEEKTEKIEKLTVAMVSALENINLANDENTGFHIKRVSEYSGFMAEKSGHDELFVRRIKLYSTLHDIGKVAIPRDILTKPGKYTAEEFKIMKEHATIGGRMFDNDDVDPMAREIALYHHEKWDGSGYNAGLSGENIPIAARIVAIADVFDALTTERPYKKALSAQEALKTMEDETDTHFDPDLFKLFHENFEEIISLMDRLAQEER